MGGVAWQVASLRSGTRADPATRLLTVTSFPGAEQDPSLSPDGNFVAFSWSGPGGEGKSDIWIKPGGGRRPAPADQHS